MTSTTPCIVDRRPLPIRDRQFFKRAGGALAQRAVTPNTISTIGLVAGVLSGVALAGTSWTDTGLTQRALWLSAIVLILLRGACNILDGIVAIDGDRTSPVGTLYNEVPDRISDAAMLIGAGYALGGHPTLGWAAAVAALFVAYVRAQTTVAGAAQDYGGPMAKPTRMGLVVAAGAYVLLTPSAWHVAFGPDGSWGLMSLTLMVICIGGVITAWRRLHRAARDLRRTTS